MKNDYECGERVQFYNTDENLNGLTGSVVGHFKLMQTSLYVILLDEHKTYNGWPTVIMSESHLTRPSRY